MAIKQSEIEKLEELYTSALRLYELKEVRMALIGIKQMLENIAMLICEQEGIETKSKEIKELVSSFQHHFHFKYPIIHKKFYNNEVQKVFYDFLSYGNQASVENIVDIPLAEIEKLANILDWFKEYADFTSRPTSEENYINKDAQALNHCLRFVNIHNYQCIKALEIPNIPLDAQFIVFTGENGFGKTAILQAITIGLNGNMSDKEILCDNPNTKIKIEVRSKVYNPQYEPQTIINEFLGYGKTLSNSMITIKHLAAYGASRLQLESQESMSKETTRKSPVYNLFHDDGVLRNIEYRPDLAPYIIPFLKKMLPHISNIEYKEPAKRDWNHYSQERLIFLENGQEILTNNLSAGNKSIFGMIGDLIIRLSEFNYSKNLSDYEGIVLIDELEAHLHPKWQREFPRLLAEIFPKVQFIVTTHSAITFLGMPSNSVFYNVTSHPEKGTQAERIDIDIENLLPNQILTSPIFGMENIKHVQNQNGNKVRTEDNYVETLKREEVRNALKEAAKNFSFPPQKD